MTELPAGPPTDVVQDIEETAEQLDADTGQPAPTLPIRQREVLTSTVEYSLPSLAQLLGAGRINLSPRYQRRARWGPERRSRLIESFLMGVPVPPVYLNEDKRGAFSVIDGKQRLLAIRAFFANELTLADHKELPELNGLTYETLPDDFRASLDTISSLRSIIVLADSKAEIKYEVFLRLNRGGIQLNAQEVRNSSWPGPLNDLILDLSESARFRGMLRVGEPSTSVIVREMRDAELVLRFFTFADTWRTFSGGIATAMNKYMDDNQYPSQGLLQSLRRKFEEALSSVDAALGENAFRRWVPASHTWRNQILAALFDAEMLALHEFPAARLREAASLFQDRFIALFDDPVFRSQIDAATNTPALFQGRIQRIVDLALEVTT